MWQDKVLALCQLAFVPSMLPTLRGPDKPALSTSVLNAVIVAVIVVTQATLGLWLAVATGTLIALTWVTLAVQSLRAGRPGGEPVGGVAAREPPTASGPPRPGSGGQASAPATPVSGRWSVR